MEKKLHAQGGLFAAPAHFIRLTILTLLPALILGCVTGSDFVRDDTQGVYVTPERVLEQAKCDLENENYAAAIHRLLDVMSRGTSTPLGREARLLLARAHMETGAYQDARLHLLAYLQDAPEGPERALAEEMLAKAEAETGESSLSTGELQASLNDARKALEANPDAPRNWLTLADIQWKQGRFEDAAVSYRTIMSRWPDYAGNPPISDRMELGDDGRYYPLTPAVVTERAFEAEPLVVYGVNSYTSSKQGWQDQSIEDAFYHVTGIVKNRSQHAVKNVSVEVRLYGAVADLFDTQTARVGKLAPGAEKAFSFRFSNFDNIHNVSRHEIHTSYEKD